MVADTDQTLAAVFCDVLSKMAFMFADASNAADLPAPEGPLLATEIRFRGATGGALRLAAPAALCPALAANVLGLDESDAEAGLRAQDALGELLNVTCGHYLTEREGDQAVYDLQAPVTGELTVADWDAWRALPGVAGFLVEGHPLLLSQIP